MFTLGILIGIFSYIIFLLGILNLLYKSLIISVSSAFFLIILYSSKFYFNSLKTFSKVSRNQLKNSILHKVKDAWGILSILTTLVVINFIGVLGPEYAFDATWYHLTIPKLYLSHHSIFYIPGGLLYYSAMPKLTEMLYLVGLSLGNEIIAKFIHYSFGILCVLAIYTLSRRYFSNKLSLLVGLIFYSNLVVSWESITAYIDLARTFYEFLTLWAFLLWVEKGERKSLLISGTMFGLAISTKLISMGSFLLYLPLIAFISYSQLKKIRHLIDSIILFVCSSLITALPWFLFAFKYTGNPVYPVFTAYHIDSPIRLFSLEVLVNDFITIFLFADDPISPIYLISLPLIVLYFRKFRSSIKIIGIYSFLALIIWYFTPRTGGGRFIVPYLPSFSILIGEVITLSTNKKILKSAIISCVIVISCISVIYRGMANGKYLPVILGIKSRDEFLVENLNFSFGDFYDTDGYFRKNINSSDKVLLYGFHNLYYVNFPFIDSSWVKEGDRFNYVAVQSAEVPKRFSNWKIIYNNPLTRVSVYTKNKEFHSY